MASCSNIMYFLDFPYSVGGASKVLLTQAYIIQQKGKNAWIVIPNDENGQHAYEFDEICRNYGLKVLNAQYSVSPCMEAIDIFAALKESKEILELFRKYEVDFVHSTQVNVAVELAAREYGIPHLMNVYQSDKEAFALDWLPVYPCYHSADSQLMCGRWSDGLQIPSRCVRVAYQRKEMERITESSKEQIDTIVLGLLTERKNQLEIIKFAMLCREKSIPVSVTFLGNNETSYGENCKKFVEENGLENTIKFTGLVLNIEDYFAKADLMILASTVESYPGVIVESMGNKVPVLSTPVAGVPELLKDEHNAFMTKGFRCEDIYDAFLRYMSYRQNDEISTIVENAYRTYQEYHTYESVGTQLENYYNWIVNDYQKKAGNFIRKAELEDKLERFIIERDLDRNNSSVMEHLWFLYHIAELVDQKDNKKLVIWGAGNWGSIVLEWLQVWGKQIEFVGFIDSVKQGEYLGYPIVATTEKEDIIDSCGTVLVAVANVDSCLEILNYLEERGKVRNKDYFLGYNSPIRI